MPIEIRETTVTPIDADYDAVQLRISDAANDEELTSVDLTIFVRIRALRTPTVAHLQRAAMEVAQDALTPLLQDLARELKGSGYGLEIAPKNPRLV
jgi:hypothetical protein